MSSTLQYWYDTKDLANRFTVSGCARKWDGDYFVDEVIEVVDAEKMWEEIRAMLDTMPPDVKMVTIDSITVAPTVYEGPIDALDHGVCSIKPATTPTPNIGNTARRVLGPDEDTNPGLGCPTGVQGEEGEPGGMTYPALYGVPNPRPCYVCGRKVAAKLARSSTDKMHCCLGCAEDLGYEALPPAGAIGYVRLKLRPHREPDKY